MIIKKCEWCGNEYTSYKSTERRFCNNKCAAKWRGQKQLKSKPEPKLCECGCGEYANPGRRFIFGHQRRGIKASDETCKKISKSNKERFKNPLEREKSSEGTLKRLKEHPETLLKMIESQNKRWEDPLEHEKASKGAIKRFKNPLERKKAKERTTKCWDEPKYREKFINAANKYWEDPISHERASAAHLCIPYDKWENFATNSSYCPLFDDKCRKSNREKYNRRCFLCDLLESENITKNGKQWKLSVHHVDMDKMQGCNGRRWKLIPVCMKCHGKLHNELWQFRIMWLLENVW